MDEQHLSRALNDKLRDLSAGDLLPDFDRQQTWEELQRRMHGPRPARRVLPVWSYAAAAAFAGLIIGGLAVRFLGSDRGGSAPPFITHRLMPATETRPPTNTAENPSPAVSLRDMPPARDRGRAAVVSIKLARPAITPGPAAQPAGRTPVVAQTPPGYATPMVSPAPKPRARHLLDIDASCRTAILNDQETDPQQHSVGQYIMVRTMPPATPAEAPAAILPRFR